MPTHVVKLDHLEGKKLHQPIFRCGRKARFREFCFMDAQHVALAVGGSIQPCQNCIKAIIKELNKELEETMTLNNETYKYSPQKGIYETVTTQVILKDYQPLLYHVKATIGDEEHNIDLRDYDQEARPMFKSEQHIIDWLTSIAKVIYEAGAI